MTKEQNKDIIEFVRDKCEGFSLAHVLMGLNETIKHSDTFSFGWIGGEIIYSAGVGDAPSKYAIWALRHDFQDQLSFTQLAIAKLLGYKEKEEHGE
jgi:HEAT repeat protein